MTTDCGWCGTKPGLCPTCHTMLSVQWAFAHVASILIKLWLLREHRYLPEFLFPAEFLDAPAILEACPKPPPL